MVVPAAPVVPGDDDGRILPIGLATVVALRCPDRVDDRCHPLRTQVAGRMGMIRILTVRDHPVQTLKVAALDVPQDLSWVRDDVGTEFGTSTRGIIAILVTAA